MSLMAMNDAAKHLGVSLRQIQRLAKSGDLRAVGLNRLEVESVLRYERQVAGRRTRAWAEPTAWAAVALLSGVEANWMGQAQQSRLKARLRLAAAEDLVGACRNRATVHRFAAHRAAVERIRSRVIESGTGNALSGLTANLIDMADGYLGEADLSQVVDRYALSTEGDGDADVILRTTSFDLDVVRSIAAADQVLAALDLATSVDTRERSAGLRVLAERLEQFA